MIFFKKNPRRAGCVAFKAAKMPSDSEGEDNASSSEGEGAGAQDADRAALKKQLSDAIASAKSHVGRVWTAVDLDDEEFSKQHKNSTLASLLGVDDCFIGRWRCRRRGRGRRH